MTSVRAFRATGILTGPLSGVLVALAAFSASAQPPLLPIASTPTCPQCSIEMDEVAILQLPSDSLSFKRGTWAQVTRLPDGRFLVIGLNETPSPALLDERGTFVRLLSGRGMGPGEYQSPYEIAITPHDTIWVMDSGRRHVYAPDLRWIRSEQFRSVGPMLVAPNGNMVFARSIPDAARAGYPLHLMRGDGQLIRSFGVHDPVMDPRRMQAVGESPSNSLIRHLVKGHEGTFWAYTPHKFLLERYDYEGRLIRQARHVLDGWYRDASESWPSAAEFRGTAVKVVAESQDPNLLWLVYYMRNSSYRPPDSLFTPTDRQRMSMVDIVIEAIDTRTMQVITNRRISRAGVLRMNNAPDLLAFYRPLDEEMIFMSYSVRSLRVVRP